MQFRCLLFDLDGTLIDSRADLTNSINLMLQELNADLLPPQQILSFVGEGVRLLVERSLRVSWGNDPGEPQILQAMQIFATQYQDHMLDHTTLYPEVKETLSLLSEIPKAVVTNKQYKFSRAILEGLEIAQYFMAVIGGDSTSERKPAAEPLLEAARLCNARPEECLMIGDTRIDILAGKAAGIKTCGYVNGFRGSEELITAQADYLISSFGELIELVKPA